MKKIVLPAWLLLASSFYVNAQNRPVNPSKDKIEFQGFTVRLLPAAAGTYGYDILKDKALILHQTYNPFTMAPVGLRRKDDVYKIAKWQIAHMNSQSRPAIANNSNARMIQGLQEQKSKPVSINKPLGKDLAKQLNINIH